jgi:hypothetical protein
VGSAIYKLRRFIGTSFDVYFHLWSSGAPHWEREKRLWEGEEARKWEKVMSRNQKRLISKSSRSPRKHTKKVHFADKLILDSPVVKSIRSVKPSTIKFGSFVFDLHSEAETERSTHERCGILKKPGFLPDDEVFFTKRVTLLIFCLRIVLRLKALAMSLLLQKVLDTSLISTVQAMIRLPWKIPEAS